MVIVIISDSCQLDRIYDHLGDGPVQRVILTVFIEM